MEGDPLHTAQSMQGAVDEHAGSAAGDGQHTPPVQDQLSPASQLLEPLLPLIESFISRLPNAEHQQTLRSLPPETLLLLVLGIVTLLFFLLLRLLSPSKSALAPVVLAGPCGAGKTGEGDARTRAME